MGKYESQNFKLLDESTCLTRSRSQGLMIDESDKAWILRQMWHGVVQLWRVKQPAGVHFITEAKNAKRLRCISVE